MIGARKVNDMQARAPGSADLLLLNGRIWTGVQPGDPASREVEALAVRDGRVLATGDRDALRALVGAGTTVVDLEGRRAVPGLVDAHIHAIRAGLTWDDEVRLGHCQRLDDVLAAIRGRADQQPAGSWVRVLGGWHPSQLAESRLPSRAELDAVAPDHPVYVQALYDAAVLNSAALAASGVTRARAGSLAGELERDPVTGEPTGVVRGMLAYPQILARMPRPSFEQQVASTRSMLRSLTRLGLVGVIDPGGIGIRFEEYDPLFELWRRGQLPLRTRIYYSAAEAGGELAQFEELTRYAQPCFGDDWLRVVGLGEIAHYEWHDRGVLAPHDIPPRAREEFLQISRLAARRGWPMHMHAIVAGTVDAVLDVWERVDREVSLRDLRFSLAHADAISPSALRRAQALGIGIGVQDWLVFKASEAAVQWGEETAANAPPVRDMLDLGIRVAAGSDSTRACSENPWLSLWWLVTGQSLDGGPRRDPRQRLSRAEALDLYTRAGAWFSFEEDRRGTLQPGWLADLAVLSDDFLTCDEEAIPSLESELTLVGGRVAHAGPAFAGLADAARNGIMSRTATMATSPSRVG
ncbi:MAG TPA: amidohydrolase [Actinomycetes bacterium]|nr:amidohydrolase [Actinomycetes bacterium]